MSNLWRPFCYGENQSPSLMNINDKDSKWSLSQMYPDDQAIYLLFLKASGWNLMKWAYQYRCMIIFLQGDKVILSIISLLFDVVL